MPFPDRSFDFVTAFMSLMDIPEPDRVLAEAHRVLAPGGFLQFSILHPSIATAHMRKLRDENGVCYAFELGGYFDPQDGRIQEWIFSTVPDELKNRYRAFRIPNFDCPLSWWLNSLIDRGFAIERLGEPCPDDRALTAQPKLAGARVWPHFLHVRCRR